MHRNMILENYSATQCFFLEINTRPPPYFASLYWLCIVLHGFSCLPAVFGNFVITLTVWKTPSLRRPSFVLLSCIALADALTGLLAQPVAIASFVTKLQDRFLLACVLDIAKECLAWVLSGLSVSILALLSVDRYLALHLGFNYRTVVTIKRVLLVVLVFWVTLAVLEIFRFFIFNNRTYVTIHVPFMFLGLLGLTATYFKIYQCIKRQKLQTSPETHGQNAFDFVKYKKTTSAVFIIVWFYWLFLAPFVFVLVAYLLLGFTDTVEGAYYVTTTVVLANAAVNPFLYCWRLRELRKAVYKEFMRLFHNNAE